MEYKYHHNPPYESGDEIRSFQDRLNYIRNTYHYGWDYINADGVFGRRTRNAVKGFNVTFAGSPGSGDLDEKTQSLITSKYYECQRGYSSNPGMPNCVDPTISYADQGYSEIANCSKGGTEYNKGGTRNFAETSNKKVKGGDDDGFTLQYFIDNYKNNAWSVFQDFYTIISEGLTLPLSSQKVQKTYERLKPLWTRVQAFCQMVIKDVTRIGNMLAARIDDFIKPIKQRADTMLKNLKSDPAKEIEKLTKKSSKGGKGGTIASLVLAGLPMIYYLVRWIIAAVCGDDTDYYKKEFFSSFQSFIGAVIIMLVIEGAVALITAAGVAAGTVAIIAAIIAIVVAIIDLIVIGLTDHGIGDWIMIGLNNIGEFLGDKAWEATEYAMEKREEGIEIFALGFEYWGNKLGFNN